MIQLQKKLQKKLQKRLQKFLLNIIYQSKTHGQTVSYVCGMVMLPITVIFMLLVIGKNEDCVGSIGGIICGVQLIPLIGAILPTEIALKKNFDKNGTRR